MDKLTDAQIMAADAILEMCNINGSASPFRVLGRNNDNSWGLEIDEIIDAADFLIKVGIIKPISTNVKDGHIEYMFTSIGEKEYIKGKRTVQYLQEEADKEAKQLAIEERDEKTKDAQLQKLEAELAVLKDMQNEQRKFWQSGIERDKRQRWQYWLTTLVAGAAFIIAVLSLLADILKLKG